jgi:hypothetical protein
MGATIDHLPSTSATRSADQDVIEVERKRRSASPRCARAPDRDLRRRGQSYAVAILGYIEATEESRPHRRGPATTSTIFGPPDQDRAGSITPTVHGLCARTPAACLHVAADEGAHE